MSNISLWFYLTLYFTRFRENIQIQYYIFHSFNLKQSEARKKIAIVFIELAFPIHPTSYLHDRENALEQTHVK